MLPQMASEQGKLTDEGWEQVSRQLQRFWKFRYALSLDLQIFRQVSTTRSY